MSRLVTLRRRTRSYSERLLSLQRANLVGYWPLSDRSGTSAVDASGNARTGTLKAAGEPLLAQAGIGDGLPAPLFDGVNDSINLFSSGLATAFNSQEGTLALWLKVAAAGVWTDATARTLFEIGDGANNRVYATRTATANQLQIAHKGAGTTRGYNVLSSAIGWLHLALVWSQAEAMTRAYFNANHIGATGGTPTTWAAAATRAVIGAFNAGGSNPWSGQVAHVGLWNAALAGPALAQLANRAGHVFFEGDSRTFGTGGTVPYSDACMVSVNTTRALGHTNIGVSGQTILQMAADAATQIDAQRQISKRIVVALGGTNDAAQGVNATTIFNRLLAYVQARQAAGSRVIVCTELPGSDTTHNTIGWNSTIRPALNTLIRNAAATNGYVVADLAADATIGVDAASDSASLYGDKLHPTDLGYSYVWPIVASKIAALAA